MAFSLFDEQACLLGEGPLWHPKTEKLFWFDILGKCLYARSLGAAEGNIWDFDGFVSAAGWINDDELLIASEHSLSRLHLGSDSREVIVDLEADHANTRSNDGRADPWGGFWIGTMGKSAEADAGAIYRYYQGELRRLYQPITIPNAICFAPNRSCAYFADSTKRLVWRQRLEAADGWPTTGIDAEPEVFLDFTGTDFVPDGAVCDRQGRFWLAVWGGAQVACFSTDATHGKKVASLPLPTAHITCPAFGGTGLGTLFATSAQEHLGPQDLKAQPDAGKTFLTTNEPDIVLEGQAEHQVFL